MLYINTWISSQDMTLVELCLGGIIVIIFLVNGSNKLSENKEKKLEEKKNLSIKIFA